jgi:hypothetical protein
MSKRIAPRLLDGSKRVPSSGGLPEPVAYGLKCIAAQEGKSVSWVKERVIIQFFRLRLQEMGIEEPAYKNASASMSRVRRNVVSRKRGSRRRK